MLINDNCQYEDNKILTKLKMLDLQSGPEDPS